MSNTELNWSDDTELAGYEAAPLTYPDDYAGEVVATLVRRKQAEPSTKAVLYIHGYVDYFFNPELADAFHENGYTFYALDLRKCGRSLRPHQRPHFCKSLSEYHAEIDDVIRLLTDNYDHSTLLLLGHSTGGLIASLYAGTGQYRDRLDALVLNSPFFDWHLEASVKRQLPIMATLGKFFPGFGRAEDGVSAYFESLYADVHGEWAMNKAWRPVNGFPIYAGWVRAINKGHQRLKQGLNIQCPVLLLSSDKSLLVDAWSQDVMSADIVLDIEHMQDNMHHLGNNVTYIQVKDGIHDLFLSRKEVRAKAREEVFKWIETLDLPTQQMQGAGA